MSPFHLFSPWAKEGKLLSVFPIPRVFQSVQGSFVEFPVKWLPDPHYLLIPLSPSASAPLHCSLVPTVNEKSNVQFRGCDKNCPRITEAAVEGQDLDQSSRNLLKKSQNNQILPLRDNPCTFSLLALKDADQAMDQSSHVRCHSL